LRDEVAGGWRNLHNEELRDLYSSPSLIRMIRWIRLAEYVARMRKNGNAYRFLMESQKERVY
jgi:hypothetical protein